MSTSLNSETDLVVGSIYLLRGPTGNRVRFLGYTTVAFAHPEFSYELLKTNYSAGCCGVVLREVDFPFAEICVGTRTRYSKLYPSQYP